jgi:transketolase
MLPGKIFASAMRRIILERSYHAHVGHIGSALSVVDMIAALYSGVLHIPDPTDPNRDRFILSKGHAALALYAAFSLKGWLAPETLASYCADGTLLAVHPEPDLPTVDFATGSLGMGLSYAVGAALAAKLQSANRRIFVLISDAECNEGATWEAAMLASQHKLNNLTVLIDLNSQQALSHTRNILDATSMRERWSAFGWDAHDINGHAHEALTNALAQTSDRPRALVAHTTFGKGVSFMENQVKWHYWPMSADEYQTALADIEQLA